MDTTSETTNDTATMRADLSGAHGGAEQTVLPLDGSGVEPAVTLDQGGPGPAGAAAEDHQPGADPDGADEGPIGFALTTRARRAVAPASVPPLSIVAGTAAAQPGAQATDGALEEAGDTRPARARALRRAKVPVSEIARQLDTDTFTVAAWVGEASSTGDAARAGAGEAAVADPGAAPADVGADSAEEAWLAHHLARAAAGDVARQRLTEDPAFALGAGILASVAQVDRHAITLSAAAPELLARALDALAGELPAVRERVRVIARVGPEAAGDLIRHRIATALGVEPAQVSWTRWRGADRPDAVGLLVRVADPDLAATVGGWVDAALDPVPEAAAAWHA